MMQGWYNNNQAISEAVAKIVENMKANPMSIATQGRAVVYAQRALERARKSNTDIHSTKSAKAKHHSCSEDLEKQTMVLRGLCDKYIRCTETLTKIYNHWEDGEDDKLLKIFTELNLERK